MKYYSNHYRRSSSRLALFAMFSAVPLWGAPAIAQATGTVGPEEQAANAVDEIIVTARKRSESALDVPISLTVFSEAALEKAYIKGLVDLQNSVPGLFFQERGGFQTYVSIRGVGGDARNIGLESGVSVAIDGVGVGRSNAFNLDLAEIAQVEVLRGPQGTLFGTNTIGGVINITTKRPSADTEINADVSYGNYETVRSTVSASGGLSDTLFAGISVSSWNSRGYIYNETIGSWLQGQNKLGVRGQLLWVPTDRLEVYITGDKTRNRREETLSQCVEPFTAACAAEPPDSRYEITAEAPNFHKGDYEGVNGTIDYELDNGFALKSITAYRHTDMALASDGDATTAFVTSSGAAGPYTEELKYFTQEIRVVSPDDKPLRFVGGLFYSNADVSSYRFILLQNVTNEIVYGGNIKTNTYAGYLNADFDVTDFLTLNGGVRYNSEKKNGSSFQTRTGRPDLTYNFTDLHRKDTGTSWTGSAKVKFTPDISSFVTVSRGFKSGGFQADLLGSAGLTEEDINFAPESVTNYEAGIKANLFDRKLRVNLAVFQLDYKDRQVLQFVDPGPPSPPFTTITNAGKSRTKGIEADATLVLPRGWSLTGAFSHLDAKYTKFDNVNAAGDSYTGNFTETTPRYTGYIGVDNETEIGQGRIIFHADASYNGKTYFSPTNDPQNAQDGYWLFNGRVGYERDLNEAGNTVGIFAFVKNAGNKDFFLYKRQGFGANQGVYGNPRFYGLQLSYKY